MARREKDDWIELPTWLSNIILYGLALLLFYYTVAIMWEWGLVTFLGFFISTALSFYRGVVLREPGAPAIIAIVYMLTNSLANALWPTLKENVLSKSFFTAFLIAIIWVAVYLRAKEIKDSVTK